MRIFLVYLIKHLHIINATHIKQRTTKHFLNIADPNLEKNEIYREKFLLHVQGTNLMSLSYISELLTVG